MNGKCQMGDIVIVTSPSTWRSPSEDLPGIVINAQTHIDGVSEIKVFGLFEDRLVRARFGFKPSHHEWSWRFK